METRDLDVDFRPSAELETGDRKELVDSVTGRLYSTVKPGLF
jgi:hypothetical protein